MRIKMDIPIIIFAFLLVYIIVIIASVFIQKISMPPTTQTSPAGFSTGTGAAMPPTAPQAYFPEIISPGQPKTPSSIPHPSKNHIPLAAPPEVPAPELAPPQAQTTDSAAFPYAVQQTSALSPYPVIYTKPIPSNQDIEESIEAQKQRQQMVESMIAERRKQEAKVRAAVENASPRDKK